MKLQAREFTGRHMLIIMLAFFGVIIAVNVVMARFAVTSWTGLVVENSYVASQQFNEKMVAVRTQNDLGWVPKLEVADGKITFTLIDRIGNPVTMSGGKATFQHPTFEAADWSVSLVPSGNGQLSASSAVSPGVWVVNIEIDCGLATPYRHSERILVKDGARL
ncbi:FixH family protein [Rhizobium sp. PL01]|uniref:FixH family protein n=1 Tax=Rhizobium sp. PL01 TaxID=3085631 RepID=UPI002982663C|nr:FixH family protein [Rhizobium sp. PL01]MDW5316736.1 FixH family protein [Rhizobium sp. PL01]